MKKGRFGFGAAAMPAALFLIIFAVLFLPEAVPAREEAGRSVADLGTITVTAEKQKENVQDVSSSITVMDAIDIEDKKIESVTEIIDYVPNMMIFNEGQATVNKVTTRGISAPSLARTTTSTGMYIDGVPTLGSFGYEEGLIDIERIEVLRGPQGTLYGKNTEAGAINIITRAPDNEYRGRVSVEGGQWLSSASDDKLTGGAALSLSGPIAKDRLYFSLAGDYDHKAGFMYNTFTGDSGYEQNNYFSRGKLRWTPAENLDISLMVSYLYHEQDGASNLNLGENGAALFGLPLPSPREISSDMNSWQEVKSQIQSLKLTYDLSDTMTLTSITSRKKTTFDGDLDFDFSPAHILHTSQSGTQEEKISQELRLGQTAEKLNWLIGFYYDRDDRDAVLDVTSMIPAMNYVTTYNLTGDAYAFFAQAGYFLTDQFKIITGLRYEHQDNEIKGLIPAGQLDASWEKVSPKIAAEYHFTPDIMLYADVSQGYRSGGFNELAFDPQFYSYDEETLWSYEIGMKSLFLDRRLMLNTALFYMDISDMQVEEAVDPYNSWITNAAEATSSGIELELVARLTDSLTLLGGFGYTNVEFDQFSDSGGDYKGNKNPFAPEYTFNIGAQYRHAKGFYARIDLIGYGEMFFDKANQYSRDAYQVVNGKIGYETRHFDIYLFGKNIFDETYNSNGYYGGNYVVCSPPGEVGLQVVGRF